MTTAPVVLCWLGIILTCLGLALILMGYGPWPLVFSGAGLTCSGLGILTAWRG